MKRPPRPRSKIIPAMACLALATTVVTACVDADSAQSQPDQNSGANSAPAADRQARLEWLRRGRKDDQNGSTAELRLKALAERDRLPILYPEPISEEGRFTHALGANWTERG